MISAAHGTCLRCRKFFFVFFFCLWKEYFSEAVHTNLMSTASGHLHGCLRIIEADEAITDTGSLVYFKVLAEHYIARHAAPPVAKEHICRTGGILANDMVRTIDRFASMNTHLVRRVCTVIIVRLQTPTITSASCNSHSASRLQETRTFSRNNQNKTKIKTR